MKNIFKIIKFAKPLYGTIAIISILILVTAILQLISPILSKFIVDEITLNLSGDGGSINKLAILIAASFGISMIASALNSGTNRLGDHFSGELRKYLTEQFYSKILTLPQEFFDSQISGKISSQLARGIDSIKNFSSSSTNFFLPTFAQSILTILILAYYSIPIAAFITILFPIYFYLTKLSTDKWGKLEEKKNKIEDVNRGRIQEVISNIKLVKSFTNEENEFDLVSDNLGKSNQIYAKQSKTFHKIDFIRNTSLNIVLLLVSIIVFYQTFIGAMSLGEMVLIIQLVNMARRPLFAMSFILTAIQQTESGSKEFFEIMDLTPSENTDFKYKPKNFIKPNIEFENISFNYKDSNKVLNNVSFEINYGEQVALVGHSGAGKSTIINLLLKFYNTTNGDIKISGNPYSEIKHEDIRHNISLVLQENELFSTTIRENVAYGMENAKEKDIISALKAANAYGFVKKFKKGLDTNIGEKGLKLSGGQKQRIQIARAILKDAPILILDEATSNLDSKSESQVHKALENLMKGRSVIIIAHRFSTIQNVNKIIVIDNTEVADIGTPSELAKRKGIYSELLNYQIEGNKKLLKEFELY